MGHERVIKLKNVNISVKVPEGHIAISPYIYGVNEGLLKYNAAVKSIRAGGNRYTAYNWVNNASNAGSDWHHSSDNHLVRNLSEKMQKTPGAAALNLALECNKRNGAYSLMTLQMAGYVSADKNGAVTENDAAPSERWNKVEFAKGSEFSLEPDLDGGVVYMDEFVNYLVNKLGSASEGGIKGYSLDNEPALWKGTHRLIHPEKATCREIVERSIGLASAVKAVDPNAEIFGPALYGFNAFATFQDAADWEEVSEGKDYKWFIDYYLNEMKKASDKAGIRLLDVLDIHYYNQALGECGERKCTHYDNEVCVSERLNAPRTLWEEGYRENSWIAKSGSEFLPILPNIKESIDKYYPGTKIAITEYSFHGGDDICGAIVEADVLGVFAKNGVYMAHLFSGQNETYTFSAMNLYTNYDGKGNGFGDTLVSCESDDIDISTAYASVFGDSTDVVTLVVTNKSFSEKTTARIALEGGDYGCVKVYNISSASPEIADITNSGKVSIEGNVVTYEMEPETVSLLVIAKDEMSAKMK